MPSAWLYWPCLYEKNLWPEGVNCTNNILCSWHYSVVQFRGLMWQNPWLGQTETIYIESSIIQLSIVRPCIKQCALLTWRKQKKQMPPTMIIRNTFGLSEWWSLISSERSILFSSLSLPHCFGCLQHHLQHQACQAPLSPKMPLVNLQGNY